MRYRARKVDGNHAAIGRVLRAVTVVVDVHGLGAVGCDYIARHVVTKAPMLIEVKDPTRPKSARDRSANERKMRDDYPNHWRQVLTGDDALEAVGIRVTSAVPGPK